MVEGTMKIKKAKYLKLPQNPSIDEWDKIEEDFGNKWYLKSYKGSVIYPYVQFGDIVEEAIVNYFISIDLPVTINNNLIQCGKYSGKSFDESTRKAGRIYFTFKKEKENWVYCGKCFLGETKQQINDIFADDKERFWTWDTKRLETFVRNEIEWFRKIEACCESVPWRLYYHWELPIWSYLEMLDEVLYMRKNEEKAK
jgi:hypothetical protein